MFGAYDVGENSMFSRAGVSFERVISEPKIGAHGKPVVFLHPADCNGVLTELEEA